MSEEMNEKEKEKLKLAYRHMKDNFPFACEILTDCLITICDQNKDIDKAIFTMAMVEIGIFSCMELGCSRENMEINLQAIMEKFYQLRDNL